MTISEEDVLPQASNFLDFRGGNLRDILNFDKDDFTRDYFGKFSTSGSSKFQQLFESTAGRESHFESSGTDFDRFKVNFVGFKPSEEEEIDDYMSFGLSTSCGSSSCCASDAKSDGSCDVANSIDVDSVYSDESSCQVSCSSPPVKEFGLDNVLYKKIFPEVDTYVDSVIVGSPPRLINYITENPIVSLAEETKDEAEESDADSLPFEVEEGGEFGGFDSDFIPCLFGGRREKLNSWTNSSQLQIKAESEWPTCYDFLKGLGILDEQRVTDDIIDKTLRSMTSRDYKDFEETNESLPKAAAAENIEQPREVYFDPKNFPGVIKIDRGLVDLKNKRLRYKTDLCRHYLLHSKCPFGDNCIYAHGLDELRKKIVSLEYKTKVCKDYLKGVCEYGYKCTFAHVTD